MHLPESSFGSILSVILAAFNCLWGHAHSYIIIGFGWLGFSLSVVTFTETFLDVVILKYIFPFISITIAYFANMDKVNKSIAKIYSKFFRLFKKKRKPPYDDYQDFGQAGD